MIVDKPCRILNYCPYGSLVEQSPLLKKRNNQSCSVFGHQCPVFKKAEYFIDKEGSENAKENILGNRG